MKKLWHKFLTWFFAPPCKYGKYDHSSLGCQGCWDETWEEWRESARLAREREKQARIDEMAASFQQAINNLHPDSPGLKLLVDKINETNRHPEIKW